MKMYVIRREDYFKTNGGYFLGVTLFRAGSLWMTVGMTEEQRRAYRYQIGTV